VAAGVVWPSEPALASSAASASEDISGKCFIGSILACFGRACSGRQSCYCL
jgi:hypothetical protein